MKSLLLQPRVPHKAERRLANPQSTSAAAQESEACALGPALLTLVCHGRRSPFSAASVAEPVLAVADRHPATLIALLMPDSLQWLIRDGWDVIETVGRFKAYAGRLAREAGHQGPLWAPGYRQLKIPPNLRLGELTREILATPVRAGLVRQAADYPWRVVRLGSGWGRW